MPIARCHRNCRLLLPWGRHALLLIVAAPTRDTTLRAGGAGVLRAATHLARAEEGAVCVHAWLQLPLRVAAPALDVLARQECAGVCHARSQ